MPRTGTGQSVRDFVAQGITHLGLAIEFGQDRGEEDRTPRVVAQPEGALAAVEGQGPIVEVVLSNQRAGERTGSVQVHASAYRAGVPNFSVLVGVVIAGTGSPSASKPTVRIVHKSLVYAKLA